jgi:F-box and WD-40 domain protein 1/11
VGEIEGEGNINLAPWRMDSGRKVDTNQRQARDETDTLPYILPVPPATRSRSARQFDQSCSSPQRCRTCRLGLLPCSRSSLACHWRSRQEFTDSSSRKVANVEKAHEGSVLSCVVDLDTKGGIIVTGSSDSTAAVWRVSLAVDQAIAANAGQLLVTREQTLRGHTDTVLDVALASHHIITCSKDTTIRIYARDDYTLLHNIITAHTGPVNCLSLHSDSLQFVSASGDGTLVKYDLSTAQELLRVTTTGADGSSTGHGLACIAWSGPYIVTGSNDRDIRIYDTEGTLLRRLEGHTGTVRAVDLDVDEEGRGAVVSGSYDHTVVIWDIETGRIRQRFPNAHESIVLDVHLKNGRLVS